MSEVEQQITVAIKTFERPELVIRAVSSLRQFHPTMPVIIADDSKEPISFNDDPYTETLHLPFDTGISYGRNRAIERVKTPFYLLMDDDYFFNADCNLEGLVKTLETTDFDIISMRVLNYREKRGYCRGELHFAGTMERKGTQMVHYIGKNRGICQGYPCFDIVHNCYLARTNKVAKIKFDENIKIGKEHGDFFLEAKQKGVLVTIATDSYIHHLQANSSNYNSFRGRGNLYTEYYFKKHGIKSEKTIGTEYKLIDKIKYFPQKIQSYYQRIFLEK